MSSPGSTSGISKTLSQRGTFKDCICCKYAKSLQTQQRCQYALPPATATVQSSTLGPDLGAARPSRSCKICHAHHRDHQGLRSTEVVPGYGLNRCITEFEVDKSNHFVGTSSHCCSLTASGSSIGTRANDRHRLRHGSARAVPSMQLPIQTSQRSNREQRHRCLYNLTYNQTTISPPRFSAP
jgi:hypothetical protein